MKFVVRLLILSPIVCFVLEVFNGVECLLVDDNEVCFDILIDISDLQPGPLKGLAAGGHGPGQHDDRIDRHLGEGEEPRARLKPHRLPGLPRADDAPALAFVCELRPVPTATNPLGAKAVGEAGVAISPVVAVNAVLDALHPLGVSEISMPMTPARVRAAVEQAQG